MTKAIFLDRDGVINIDTHYVHKIEDFKFCKGIFNCCHYLQSLRYLLIIITNQSGIDRGYYTHNDFKVLTEWMLSKFKENGVTITDVYYCPDTPEQATKFRKPNPGMILKAQEKYNINLKDSWLIGDKLTDIEAGKNANIPNLILLSEKESIHKNIIDGYHRARTLEDINNIIKKDIHA